MYTDSNESFDIVKNILLNAIPIDISIKKHQEDDTLLVINEEYSLVFLNEISSLFLLHCDGIKRVNDIIDYLLTIYDIDRDTLTIDIIKLISKLQAKRIIFIEE